MKALVIGGNRFFGKKLALKLVEEGHDVTLLNRGNMDDGFGDKIHRITCDRTNFDLMCEKLNGKTWDLVYDQVCYTYNQAKQACELFNGKTKKYVHTSTVSIYKSASARKETNFDPSKHIFDDIVDDYNKFYSEAKRQAECAFTKYAKFPLTMLRIPIVVGLDDYTGRLSFHINNIKNEIAFYLPNKEAKISFITSDDAAKVLFHLGHSDFTGIINAASPQPILLGKFINVLESKLHKKALFKSNNDDPKLHSPYGTKENMILNTEKLQSMGVKLTDIQPWFEGLQI